MSGLRLIPPDQVGGAAPQLTARVPVESGATTGLLKFTDKLTDWAEHESNLQRIGKLADAQSEFQNALDRKRVELSSDPDLASRETKFQQFAQAEFGRIHDGMDGTTQKLFSRTANPIADSMSMSIRHTAEKERLDTALVGLRTTNEQLAATAGGAKTADERDAIKAQIESNLKQAQSTNVLSAAQYETERKAHLVKVDQAWALREIQANPSAAEAKLKDVKYLPDLDPLQRQQLIVQAGNEQLRRANLAYAQEARAEVADRRRMAKAGDEAMKEIIDLNDNNQLTERELEVRRPFLNHTEYQSAKRLLRGGTNIDDMNAVVALEPRLGEMDAKGALTKAFEGRLITRETYSNMIRRNEELLRDDQPASPYKRGREQISEALRPGALLTGPAADIQKQALVNALREYDDFASRVGVQKLRENGQIAVDESRSIIDRHRIVNFDKIGEAIGLPRYVAVPREQVSEADLKGAGAKVLQEFDNGRLSAAERDDQLRKIELWEQILKDRRLAESQPQPGKPRPPAQGGN